MIERYIWRDTVDHNQFWLGVKTNSGYYGCAAVFCDALFDLFGSEGMEAVKDIEPGKPVRIQLMIQLSGNGKGDV